MLDLSQCEAGNVAGEYVVYVHHAESEAQARSMFSETAPGAQITYMEPIKPSKWRVSFVPGDR